MLDYCSIGQRVKRFRDEKGITQEALAETVDISLSHISRIENGHTKPSLDVLVQIANALCVSVDALLYDNLTQARGVFQEELNSLLKECSAKEIKMLAEIGRAAVNAARRTYKE